MAIGRIETEGELEAFITDRLDPIPTIVRGMQGSLAGLRIRVGAATVTWPGGSSISNSLTVSHGLGKPPVAVDVTANSSGVGASFAFVATAPSGTEIVIQVSAPGFTPVAGREQTVYWLVAG